MAFTYQGLIEKIKEKEAGLMGIHLPMLSMHFIEFANQAGLQYHDYPTIQAYIKKATYQEKSDLFESLGFKVLFMTLSAIKVIHFAEGRLDHAPKDPSIEEAFLANQRNVFILDVETGMKSLYFVLEYQSDDALADYTVDRDKLAEEQARQEQLRAIFWRNKK
jgi:hypothetical protein